MMLAGGNQLGTLLAPENSILWGSKHHGSGLFFFCFLVAVHVRRLAPVDVRLPSRL
jgi:hypothetical protein